MKKFLATCFLAILCIFANAQYGGQRDTTIAGFRGLIWLPASYKNPGNTNKYPLIIQDPGVGTHTMSNLSTILLAQYITNGSWDGTAMNYNTNKVDSFVIFSIQQTMYDHNQYTAVLDAFMATNRIDINSLNATGFSGGGQITTWWPIHLTSASPLVMFTPKYKLATAVIFSAETTGNEPMDYALLDTVYCWGFGDPRDLHGGTTIANINALNKLQSNFALLTTHNLMHTAEPFYNPTYTRLIDGHNMNIYNFMLYHKRVGASTSTGGTTPPPTLTTTNLSSTSLCVTPTGTAPATVTYSYSATPGASNVWTAELSDASGNFSTPTVIGTSTSTNASGTINLTIPANQTPGTKYRIRVRMTNSPMTGTDNGADITIKLASNSVSPAATQNIYTNASGTVLTVSEPSKPNSRNWYWDTNPNGTFSNSLNDTSVTYQPKFPSAGNYYVQSKSVFACTTAVSNVVNINVSDPVVTSSSKILVTKNMGCGLYWGTGSPGDTLLVRAAITNNLCFATFHDIHGTPDKPVTIINEGVVYDSGDYKFENCSYIHFTGTGTTGILYGFVSNGKTTDSTIDNKGGAGVTLAGKDSNLVFDHILIKNKGSLGKNASGVDAPAGYGFVIKNDILCDSSTKWPMRFDSIFVTDCKADSISQDIVYLISSDPYGTQRHASCVDANGNTVSVQYRPTGASNIIFERDTFTNAGRSVQISGTDNGYNAIRNCYFYNLGYEFSPAQGGLAIGGADSSWHISNTTIKRTWLGVYSYQYGLFDFQNNTIDSSGWVYGDSIVTQTTLPTTLPNGTTYAYLKNGQAHFVGLHRNGGISGITTYAYDNPNHSTLTLKIANNVNTNYTHNYAIQLQPGNLMYATTGSCIQNSGNIYNGSPANIHYSTDCGTQQYVQKWVSTTHDSVFRVHLRIIDSTVITVSVGSDTTYWIKYAGHKGLSKIHKAPGTKTVTLYDTSYRDTSYWQPTTHDSLETVVAMEVSPTFFAPDIAQTDLPAALSVDYGIAKEGEAPKIIYPVYRYTKENIVY